jgi:peptidoglycan/LPS O-acetylase OafA/YrhL
MSTSTLLISPTRMPALDGLRGIAILLVIVHHCAIVWSQTSEIENGVRIALQFGWFGVDLFFALSGFLITGILLDSVKNAHYFSRFYWRRVIRIFPLYYAFLAFVFLVAPLLPGAPRLDNVGVGWYVTYLQNLKPNHGATDPLLGHMWSLAVEEQFYVIWPLVVYLLSRRALARLCIALAVAALSLRCVMAGAGADVEAIYRLVPCRIDALALGALAAIAIRSMTWKNKLQMWTAPVVAFCIVITVALAASAGTTRWESPLMHTVGFTFLAVMFSATVMFLATAHTGPLYDVCMDPRLRSIGKYSYAMYMIHMLPNRVLYEPVKAALMGQPLMIVMAGKIVYIAAITLLVYCGARASWVLLESPLLALKNRFFSPASAGTNSKLPPAKVCELEAVKESA